jgi:UDP-glucose:(heptosyl)LPS alpha-1,3-glucosyltransferase
MNIALCFDRVLPKRGGCETYISDLARRLAADGHELHLYACRWDGDALPKAIDCHALTLPSRPRFLRPWRFAIECERRLRRANHDVSIGFDKTWGQDVLYPQGGLRAACSEHNIRKYRSRVVQQLVRLAKPFDLTNWSYMALERRQYLGPRRPLIVVNSEMVRRHFEQYYGIGAAEIRVLRAAIDPGRFAEHDRPRRRLEARQHWGISTTETVALFAAMNYRLKGLDSLLHAVSRIDTHLPFRLLVIGSRQTWLHERLARRLGVAGRVIFAGHCADMRNAYFASDYLVHPTFYDPCSLVVLEALACGLPIITTRVNGASEMLNPPSEGYVLDDPHDHTQLAWYMNQLFDSGHRASCAQAARQTASRWTFDHHYRQMLQILSEAAARKQAA